MTVQTIFSLLNLCLCVCVTFSVLLSKCGLKNTGKNPENHSCANGSWTLFVCLVQRKENASLEVIVLIHKNQGYLICQSEIRKMYLTPANTFSFSSKRTLSTLNRFDHSCCECTVHNIQRSSNTCPFSAFVSKPHVFFAFTFFYFKKVKEIYFHFCIHFHCCCIVHRGIVWQVHLTFPCFAHLKFNQAKKILAAMTHVLNFTSDQHGNSFGNFCYITKIVQWRMF